MESPYFRPPTIAAAAGGAVRARHAADQPARRAAKVEAHTELIAEVAADQVRSSAGLGEALRRAPTPSRTINLKDRIRCFVELAPEVVRKRRWHGICG
jgi:hypothetical protein